MNKYEKLIEKQKKLIAHIRIMPGTSVTLLDVELKSKWVQKEIELESEIASFESEIAKEQEPEGVTAEEILSKYWRDDYNKAGVPTGSHSISAEDALLAMEEYAKFKEINLREELKKFNDWMCGKQYDGRIPLIRTCIDEYLKNRNDG